MRKIVLVMLVSFCTFTAVLSGCAGSSQTETPESESSDPTPDADSGEPRESESAGNDAEGFEEEDNMGRKIIVEVNGSRFTATLENNKAADALEEMVQEEPVTVQMSDYAGFEKVGSLGTSLPASNRQTTTHAGDIVLYQGNQIVIFYGSNSWSYTRLGKIDDLTGWEEALGNGDATLTLSPEEA